MPDSNENIKMRLASIGNLTITTPLQTEIDTNQLNTDLRIQFGVQVQLVRPESKVIVSVTMSYILNQLTIFSGTITIEYIVLDLASYIKVKDQENSFVLENDFMPMLVGAGFSTARGYFARQLVNTYLEKYPFPIFALSEILKRTTYQLV